MPKRRITGAKINFLSLCKRGANRMPVIYKEDGAFDYEMLLKAADDFMEKGELLAVVYAPEFRDSQGDIASATVIKDMMYSAAQAGEDIDIMHDGKALAKEAAYVAERFIVQKDDPRFKDFKDYEGKPVDVTDAWATVLKIEDQKLRDHYKAGDWNGVSMGGRATVVAEKDESQADKVIAALARKLNLTSEEDDDMNADEYKTLMAANNEELVKGIGAAVGEVVAKALKPDGDGGTPPAGDDDKDKLKAPVFKGDPTKIEDIEKHQAALASYELQKEIDWTDPESVKKYHEKLAELAKAADDKGEEDDSPEVKKLKAEKKAADDRLKEALGKSQQPAGGTPPADEDSKKTHATISGEGFGQEDADLFKMGSDMAKAANDQSGYK